MKKLLSLALSIFVAGSAYADSCATSFQPLFTGFQAAKLCSVFSAGTIGTIANNTFTTARNAANSANLSIWKADASDNTMLNAGSGKLINLAIATTPYARVDTTGLSFPNGNSGVRLAVFVPTFAATPVAGTNDLKVGLNAVPTAAANAAACLPAVPNVGDVVEGVNEGTNSVRVKACGTPGINGAAAGTYIPVATQAYFKCSAETATSWRCGTLAIPTPAGP